METGFQNFTESPIPKIPINKMQETSRISSNPRLENKITDTNKILTYSENFGGQNFTRTLNFLSPRTIEVTHQLGITFEDCIVK